MSTEHIEVLKSLRKRLEINEFSLERECRDQSILYADIGDLYIDAKRDAQEAKDSGEFIRARLSSEIRSDPLTHGITGKATEAAIESVIIQHTDYRAAQLHLLNMQEISGRFGTLLEAASQRKSLLRDLKDLFIYNYYSNIGLDKEAGELSKMNQEAYMKYKEEKRARAEGKTSGDD